MTQKGQVDVKLTDKEQTNEREQTKSKENSLLGDLANSDVVNESEMVQESESDQPDPEEKEGEGNEDKEPEEPEETEESEQDEDQDKEDEEELEDVIPKSKHEKILEKLERRIDNVVAENKVLKERQESSAKKADDPDLAKMENMSEKELDSLIDQVEDAKFDAMRSEDRDQYKRLVEVGKKAQKVMRDAPQRYQQKQQESIQRAVNQIQSDDGIENVEEAAPKIKEIAEKIFSEFPQNLRSTPEAQGTAYTLAAEHYKELVNAKPSSGKKSDSDKYKRQVNNLKKKTSLDGKTKKGDVKKVNLRKLKAKAKDGDEYDKLGYFVNSGIIDEAKLFGKK